MDEASLRAMRAEYFQGIPEHVWRSDEFNSSHHQYNEVFGRMIGEGRGVMEVATIMTQLRGRNVPSGMGNFMQDMQQMSGILNSNQSTADKKQQMEQMMEKMQKPNDRCACGSTKKYKKCCGSKKKQNQARSGSGQSILGSMGLAAAATDPKIVCTTKPTRDNKKMGWKINMIEQKKAKKKKKKSNKKNKVSDKIWISTSSPRVRDNTPLKSGIQQLQTTPAGKRIKYSTTHPSTHQTPTDPIFAIEFPNAEYIGPPIDFLRYGNYENANILSFDLPTDTTVRTNQGISKRPNNFNNVETSFVTRNMEYFNNRKWKGGSTIHKCEILCDEDTSVMYLTGQGAAKSHKVRGSTGYDELHHGNKLQHGCIHSHRPTTFLLWGDDVTEDNTKSLTSIARIVNWETTSQGDYVSTRSIKLQPDGRVWTETAISSEVYNQNLFIRAFLTAADVQATSVLPDLFTVANTAAFATGRLVEFADAVDRLTVVAVNKYYSETETCPGFELHPYPETAFGYYAFQAGEAHEAASNLLAKVSKEEELHQLKLAIASYKFGAYITSQSGAETSANYEIRIQLWDSLGLALRRYAAFQMVDGFPKFSDIYFDMAERAYCWGFACIYPYSEDRRRQNSYNKCMNRLNANLGK